MKNSPANPSDQAAYHFFQNSIDPIILTDSLGYIVVANEHTFKLLGYDPGELTGRHIAELFQRRQILPDFSSLPQDSRQVFDCIVPISRTEEQLHIEVHASQYIQDDRHIVQWILHDITRLVELDQMREDLAAMLVHDLQGPLGNILYSLELVKNELPENSSDTMRLMLDTAYRSSQHLQYLVDSLMDISHLEAGHPISNLIAVDVDELVEYVIAVEEPNLETRGVAAACTIDSNLPAVLADESMLRRVLLNLLDNALKHSRNGQTVTIEAQLDAGAKKVRFSVIDQGQGVPDTYRNLIFEKFQQVRTNSAASGLGLGLAFCRLAVEAHGGRIWVEDAPSGGACFCFTVPSAAGEQPVSTGNVHD